MAGGSGASATVADAGFTGGFTPDRPAGDATIAGGAAVTLPPPTVIVCPAVGATPVSSWIHSFVAVPALVGTEPGAEFEFSFDGTGCGLFIAAGPDAGRIEFSIDGGEHRKLDTFTHWSASLHLPWALILDDTLKAGPHTAQVRLAADRDPKGTGTALRVFHLLLN